MENFIQSLLGAFIGGGIIACLTLKLQKKQSLYLSQSEALNTDINKIAELATISKDHNYDMFPVNLGIYIRQLKVKYKDKIDHNLIDKLLGIVVKEREGYNLAASHLAEQERGTSLAERSGTILFVGEEFYDVLYQLRIKF